MIDQRDIDKLRKYGKATNDEFGEYTLALCSLAECHIRENFEQHLAKEIESCLKWYEENTEWRTDTKVIKETVTIKELIFKV